MTVLKVICWALIFVIRIQASRVKFLNAANGEKVQVPKVHASSLCPRTFSCLQFFVFK